MTKTGFNNKSYAQLLACFDNYEGYEISMREVSNEKNKTRFRSLALSFHSTLQRLPSLKQEIDVMLQSTEQLNYEELIKRVEPALQQASDWLLKIDLLPIDVANEESIKEIVNSTKEIMTFSTINNLIQHFNNEIERVKKESDPTYCYEKVYSYFQDEECEIPDSDKQYALTWLEKSASLGHSEAQYKLFRCYRGGAWGLVESENPKRKQARYWAEKSAEQGYMEALGLLSVGYYFETNLEKWLYFAEKAAKKGDEFSKEHLEEFYGKKGIMYEARGDDYFKNSENYEKITSLADTDSYFKKGENYANEGEQQNWEKAAYWFKKAAAQGHAEAQFSLALCYSDGNGVAKDNKTAYYWLQRAAQLDYVDAQLTLGKFFAKYLEDMEGAVYWLERAANQGDAEIQYRLGNSYREGDPISKNSEKAIYWLEKAASQGFGVYQFALGEYYADGDGIPKNSQKAVYWLEKGAQDENCRFFGNQFELGKRYGEGKGIPRSFEKARYWMQKAANEGFNEEEAIEWLKNNPREDEKKSNFLTRFLSSKKK